MRQQPATPAEFAERLQDALTALIDPWERFRQLEEIPSGQAPGETLRILAAVWRDQMRGRGIPEFLSHLVGLIGQQHESRIRAAVAPVLYSLEASIAGLLHTFGTGWPRECGLVPSGVFTRAGRVKGMMTDGRPIWLHAGSLDSLPPSHWLRESLPVDECYDMAGPAIVLGPCDRNEVFGDFRQRPFYDTETALNLTRFRRAEQREQIERQQRDIEFEQARFAAQERANRQPVTQADLQRLAQENEALRKQLEARR